MVSRALSYDWYCAMRRLLIGLAVVWGTVTAAQPVINELMPVPPKGEPEWLELFNAADTPVAFSNWWLTDSRIAVRLPAFVLPPRGYAVLCRDTAALREVRSLPATAVLVELRLPTLNNTSDVITLRAPDSSLVDSVYYSMSWGRAEVSLERARAELPAWSPENLLPSRSPTGATAGDVNSVTPVPVDYACADFRLLSSDTLLVAVINAGTTAQSGASYTVWLDRDGDSSFSPAELRLRRSLPPLQPGQRWEERIPAGGLWGELPRRWYVLQLVVELPGDVRRWNDTLRRRFYRSVGSSVVRINEILYDPLPNGAEFVELVNVGEDTVTLEGWLLHDLGSSSDTLRIGTALRLAPNQFAVLGWDSSLLVAYAELQGSSSVYIGTPALTLNNAGDGIVLRDPNGVAVDSVSYDPTWHDPAVGSARRGRSLEKLHPLLPSSERSSWSTCAAPVGATPGAPNSIAVPSLPDGELTASPNPFRLSAAERQYCVISYRLPFQKALVTVRIFSDEGACLRTLLLAAYSAAHGHVAWDGRSDRGELVPPGPYVVLVEAQEAGGAGRYEAKAVVVIGY